MQARIPAIVGSCVAAGKERMCNAANFPRLTIKCLPIGLPLWVRKCMQASYKCNSCLPHAIPEITTWYQSMFFLGNAKAVHHPQRKILQDRCASVGFGLAA
jgi:hypothetical protein